jgi:hypothetical protein
MTLFLPAGSVVPIVNGQSIDSSPSKSVQLFFAAVSDHKYDAASKFLPRSVIKILEREFPGGFEAFIDSIAKENEGSSLEVQSESIEEGFAKVETITITALGKRIPEKWTLRLEDKLWKLDILIPR